MLPIVMSKGSGTCLWPVSRASLPKSFCHLFDEMLHMKALKRVMPLGSPWTLTIKDLKPLTTQTYKALDLPEDQVIYEPSDRNTAPTIALLCRWFALQGKGSEVVGIFPADHLIDNKDSFHKAVELGITCATTVQDKKSK